MKINPDKIIQIELTLYETITIINQLRSSLPEPGNQMTIVNAIDKLRKAVEDGS